MNLLKDNIKQLFKINFISKTNQRKEYLLLKRNLQIKITIHIFKYMTKIN